MAELGLVLGQLGPEACILPLYLATQKQRSWGAENTMFGTTDPTKQPFWIPSLCRRFVYLWRQPGCSSLVPGIRLWVNVTSLDCTQMFTGKWSSPKIVSPKLILMFTSKGHYVWVNYRWLEYSIRKGFLGGIEQSGTPVRPTRERKEARKRPSLPVSSRTTDCL